MAYDITQLLKELGMVSSCAKVEDVLTAIEASIRNWQQRVNNPKYKQEAPERISALLELRAEVQANPDFIIQQEYKNKEQALKNYVAVYNDIERIARIRKERVVKDAGKLFIKDGTIGEEFIAILSESFNLSIQELKGILGVSITSLNDIKNILYGIDFGAEYSRVSFINEYGNPATIPNRDGATETPSCVAFENEGVYVGQEAKESLVVAPYNVCAYVKKQIGNRSYLFNANGEDYGPEAIAAIILRKITNDANNLTGEDIKDVVIAYPTYFNEAQREALGQAALIAGLNVISLVQEPIAIALSYGINTNVPQSILIFDLGSSFKVSVLQVVDNSIKVIANGGDSMLGGKDWDEMISRYFVQKYSEETGESIDTIYDDMEMMADLSLRSEVVKKILSLKNTAYIRSNGHKYLITLEEFEQLTKDLLERTINIMRDTINVAESKGIKAIDRVLLAGGASYMLQIKNRLTDEFPNISIELSDANLSVANGAALYGNKIKAFSNIIRDESYDDWKTRIPR